METPMSKAIAAILMFLVFQIGNASEFVVADDVKARLDPVLTKSGGELTYFDGPADMIGVGVSFINGSQMVVYATADGTTVFSGVAIDVASGQNLVSMDMQKLPPPDYSGLFEKLAEAKGSNGRPITWMSEGNPESTNQYYVFVDPKCPYCHKTYDAFLKVLADGEDLIVHYIPIGILGPESENLAKEMAGMPAEKALALMRKQMRREPHIADPAAISAGKSKHGHNLALFRQLQFDAVPVVISNVNGNYNVRRGALPAETITQELRVAKVEKLASVQ